YTDHVTMEGGSGTYVQRSTLRSKRRISALAASRPLPARDHPVLREDVDPGLSRLEPHELAGRVAELELVEEVRARPRDVLAPAVAEHHAGAGARGVGEELRVARRVEAVRVGE